MTVRTFLLLLFTTVIAVAAATVALISRPGDRQRANLGQPVLPGLIDRINDLGALRIESAKGGRLTIKRDGARWTIVERDGYPAKASAVKSTAVAVARLTYLSAKTAKPALYGRLDLGDPGKKDTKSVALTFTDRAGKEMGALIVGISRSAIEGSAQGGTFLRLPDDLQTWLTKGFVEVGKQVQDWIDRDLFHVKTDRIRRVEIHHSDGETVTVFKDQKDDKNFILADVPGAKKVTSKFAVDGIASNIGDFVIDDVARRADKPVDPAKAVRVVYETFDGLTLTMLLEKQKAAGKDGKDEHWLQVEATGTGDAAAEAAAIAKRTGGWSFHISDFRYTELTKHMTDLVEDVKPADGAKNP